MENFNNIMTQALQGDNSAFKKLEYLAGSGNVEAQYYLALYYEQSLNVPLKDNPNYIWWIEKAANQDFLDAKARFLAVQGLQSEQTADGKTMIEEGHKEDTKKGSHTGAIIGIFISIGLIIAGLSGEFVLRGTNSSTALVVVGCLYLIYDIVKLAGQNDNQKMAAQGNKQLFLNCLEAAEDGDIDSQFSVGVMYYYGKGINQDYEQAAMWFRQAAEHNSADAQFALGGVYLHGEGVEQDYNQAAYWFQQAANQGHDLAIERLEELAKSGLISTPEPDQP